MTNSNIVEGHRLVHVERAHRRVNKLIASNVFNFFSIHFWFSFLIDFPVRFWQTFDFITSNKVNLQASNTYTVTFRLLVVRTVCSAQHNQEEITLQYTAWVVNAWNASALEEAFAYKSEAILMSQFQDIKGISMFSCVNHNVHNTPKENVKYVTM